jgi:hypothetical protein
MATATPGMSRRVASPRTSFPRKGGRLVIQLCWTPEDIAWIRQRAKEIVADVGIEPETRGR